MNMSNAVTCELVPSKPYPKTAIVKINKHTYLVKLIVGITYPITNKKTTNLDWRINHQSETPKLVEFLII